MKMIDVNAGIETFESWRQFKNHIECLNDYNDRIADARIAHRDGHKYEVYLKEGWQFAGFGYDGEDRRYESFNTKREMLKVVKAAKKIEG